MNFYLDFEATRFSNCIISIGCVAENGNTFKTLVHPVNKAKVDKFITELTGITNEMLANAPTANEAFENLHDFIIKNSDNTPPAYYVYGNSDADFLSHTIKYMTSPKACLCAQAIQGTLIDYANEVRKFFVASSDLALRKVYMLIQCREEMTQKHDALEDAKMLQVVAENLKSKCRPEDKDTILAIPSQKRPPLKKAPPLFIKWNNSTKWEADTGADETNYVIKAIDQHKNLVKYFDSIETATLWVIKYITRVSPKNQRQVDKIKDVIMQAPSKGKCNYNCYWEYKKEEI